MIIGVVALNPSSIIKLYIYNIICAHIYIYIYTYIYAQLNITHISYCSNIILTARAGTDSGRHHRAAAGHAPGGAEPRIYIYIYIYVSLSLSIYIYIHRERERDTRTYYYMIFHYIVCHNLLHYATL